MNWRKEPRVFLESHFPGISELVEQRGNNIEELLGMWGHVYWSIEKAKILLGYRPQYIP